MERRKEGFIAGGWGVEAEAISSAVGNLIRRSLFCFQEASSPSFNFVVLFVILHIFKM